jgi:hypothetical protein
MGLLYMLTLWSNMCVIWALEPMVVCDRRNINGQSLQDEYHYRCGPIEVKLGFVAIVIYGSVQWLGQWHCITSPSGQREPC